MENWYLSIAMATGIGLIIWSASKLMVSLSKEMGLDSLEGEKGVYMIRHKLKQFKLLNKAMVFLYLSIAFFIISGLISALFYIYETIPFSLYTALMGSLTTLIGLFMLVVYSIRAVKLKQDQFNYKLTNQKKK